MHIYTRLVASGDWHSRNKDNNKVKPIPATAKIRVTVHDDASRQQLDQSFCRVNTDESVSI